MPVAPVPVHVAALPIDGNVLVAQSPADSRWNGHADPSVPQQHFAYDLAGLDDHGALYTGDGRQLTDWAGYGRPVHAPFAGTVVEAVDGWKQLQPFEPSAEVPDAQRNPAGNHVVIRDEDGTYSIVAHLQTGSVHRDLLGTRVTAGTVLGLLGNSGNTSMPHVHINVMTTQDIFAPDGAGIPLAFTGYRLLGHSIFSPKRGFGPVSPRDQAVITPTVPRRGDVVQNTAPR